MGAYDDLINQVPTVPQPSAPAKNAYADLIPQPPAQPQQAQPQSAGQGFLDSLERGAGIAGRSVVEGLTALPVMAGDAGVAAGNLINNKVLPHLGIAPPSWELQLPSATLHQALNSAGFPEPHGFMEKGENLIESGLAGSAVPMPTGVNPPDNLVTPQEAEIARRASTVQKAQDAGYVVPPSTSNPTALNQTLETIAGKQSTQQSASAANQSVTNRLAKVALGLNPDAPLTADSLSALRAEAATNGYEPIRSAGVVQAPPEFSAQLQGVLRQYQGADRSFPGMGKTDLSDVVSMVDKPQFDAGDAIDLTKVLRDRADTAFRNGDSATGSGLRQVSGIVENALDSGLQAKGPQYADALDNFRNARQLIAKTYTVQNAMNPGSGNVVASKLAAALKGGAPLSGPLLDAAQAASAFPKAFVEPTSSNVHHLDTVGALSGALLGEHFLPGHAGTMAAIAGTAYPLARMGAKAYLLGPGQAGAVPTAAATSALTQALLRGAPGAYSATQ